MLLLRGFIAVVIGAMVTVGVAWGAWSAVPADPEPGVDVHRGGFFAFERPGDPDNPRHSNLVRFTGGQYALIVRQDSPEAARPMEAFRVDPPHWVEHTITQQFERLNQVHPLPVGTTLVDVPETITIKVAGWPLPAMFDGWVVQHGSRGRMMRTFDLVALEKPPPLEHKSLMELQAMPRGILWRGFITNTLVVAVPLWLVMLLPGLLLGSKRSPDES